MDRCRPRRLNGSSRARCSRYRRRSATSTPSRTDLPTPPQSASTSKARISGGSAARCLIPTPGPRMTSSPGIRMTPSQISGSAPRQPDRTRFVSPSELRRRWRAAEEVALLDVREEGPYSLSHPFFAVSLPLSQIELRILGLIPRLDAPVIVYDGGEGYAARALQRIAALGYTDIAILEGGLAGYALTGEVFRDVNVPSKAFGELVEAIRHTPSLSADEAKTLIESEKNLVVLDARRF